MHLLVDFLVHMTQSNKHVNVQIVHNMDVHFINGLTKTHVHVNVLNYRYQIVIYQHVLQIPNQNQLQDQIAHVNV